MFHIFILVFFETCRFRRVLGENYAFPQDFHTRKLGEISVFCSVLFKNIKKYLLTILIQLILIISLPGFHLEPAIFTNVKDGMFIATEESFGPVIIISRFLDGYVWVVRVD